jgi:hypothetical protein
LNKADNRFRWICIDCLCWQRMLGLLVKFRGMIQSNPSAVQELQKEVISPEKCFQSGHTKSRESQLRSPSRSSSSPVINGWISEWVLMMHSHALAQEKSLKGLCDVVRPRIIKPIRSIIDRVFQLSVRFVVFCFFLFVLWFLLGMWRQVPSRRPVL